MNLRSTPARMVIFGCIGAANTVLDVGLYAILTQLHLVDPLVANLFSFTAGGLSSYALNGLLTFGDIRSSLFDGGQATRAAISCALCLGASQASLWVALFFLQSLPAKLATLVVTFLCGYGLSRHWVYRRAARRSAPG